MYENMNYVDLAMQKMRVARLAAKLEREKAGPPKTLKDEILEWYENLPPGENEMAWSMSFLSKHFGRAPSVLGPMLSEELGWRRGRVWKGQDAYRRKWFPPAKMLNEENSHNAEERC